MSVIDDSPNELNAIVLVGELRQDTAIWSQPYDPSFRFTDGQARSLYLRLQRLMNREDFVINQIYDFDDDRTIYLTMKAGLGISTIYCFILKSGEFENSLISNVKQIVERGGIYAPKKFYSEILELQITVGDSEIFEDLINEIDEPIKAANYIQQVNIETLHPKQSAKLLAIIGTSRELIKGPEIFNIAYKLLNISTGDIDVLLDSSFVIAARYLENQSFDFASNLFSKIADVVSEANLERLALEIACRISVARILKLRSTDDGMQILNVLSPIDDGSLEVASQNDREEYYCLQGYAFKLLEDFETAEDLYFMAIMVAESESFPSMNKAEAHNYIGLRAGERFAYDIATREFLTASSIAMRNGNQQMSMIYSHHASVQEVKWSSLLASAGVIAKMNGETSNAEYHGWQAFKRLIQAYTHADRQKREFDLFPKISEIIEMSKTILGSSSTDYAVHTMDDIEINLQNLRQGSLTPDNEREILAFLLTKISAMIPLPTPIIMLIANDGRLIIGGEVGAENWEASISDNDDLFSGALSAIMAILSEVISTDNPLRMVDAGQTQIMIEKSKVCIGALLVDRDLNIIRKALRTVVNFMETEYPGFEDWDGYSIDYSGIKPFVDNLFIEVLSTIES